MSLAPLRTPTPSPLTSRRSDSTRSGRASRTSRSASASSTASTTAWPCCSSAWRSIARRESLSSTSRIGARERGTGEEYSRGTRDEGRGTTQRTSEGRSAPYRSQPAGTPARRASSSRSSIAFLFASISSFTRSNSASAFLRSVSNRAALRGIVAGGEVGPERVDLALERVEVHLAALERLARVGHPLPPGLLVLLALLLVADFRLRRRGALRGRWR